jgi:hypothetical protein
MTHLLKTSQFSSCKRRTVLANFNGGDITSNGGVLLLREVDKQIGLSQQLAKIIPDHRDTRYCKHLLQPLLQQRIYGLALGYEDLNDHDSLRKDIALQTAVDRVEDLAGSSTLSRLENSMDRQAIIDMHQIFFKQLVNAQKKPPKELILDFDATDDLVHGNQEKKFYHGYYRSYCFLPLYVFCGEHLLVSYLRPSNIDGAKHAWGILALLVKELRKTWPKVRIIFRGDGGFARHKMFDWCEKHDVGYITGISSNNRLRKQTQKLQDSVNKDFEKLQTKQRQFDDFYYAAKSWAKKRRIIVKAEHTKLGPNTRFIVTNLEGEAQYLYDQVYCARGDMENRIKEQQLDLFADRTSCHEWIPNQFRLMLSGMAYTLMQALKRLALKATHLIKAQCGTLRLKLFKIGAVVIRNTRSIKFLLTSSHPNQNLFHTITRRLIPE